MSAPENRKQGRAPNANGTRHNRSGLRPLRLRLHPTCTWAARRTQILALALLHLLTFLTSGTFAPSRWDMQDPGHMTAALPICRPGHRTRRLQSGGLRGAILQGFRKNPWRSAIPPAQLPGVLYSLLHFVVGSLCLSTNIRALRTYRKIPHKNGIFFRRF